MVLSSLFDDLTTTILAKSLDTCGLRHRVIANNIANVETPGFKRSDVAFESALKLALSEKNGESAAERIRRVEPEVVQDGSSPCRPDGNNVSIDKEMADMTKNTLQYEALVQLLNLKASMIRSAIQEGRK